MTRFDILRLVAPLAVSAVALPATAASGLQQAIEQTVVANVAAAKSQKKIDAVNDETAELVARYRALLEQIDSLRVYNKQLEELTAAQQAELESVRTQIDNATSIAREMTPLMLRMLDAIEQFIELDVPFLMAERRERIAKLREIMARADVTESEKYRRIVEAYQVENEYGRTIESYKGDLEAGGTKRTVEYLRVGRLALIYQTLDARESGIWNKATREWQELPSEYRSAISKGLRIARKQAAPDLVRLPISAPEDAR